MSLTLLDLSEAKIALGPLAAGRNPDARGSGKTIRAVEAGAPRLFPFQGGADAGYRRLSQQPNVRDLLPFKQDEMQRLSYFLSATNNLAKRMIQYMVDYVCGEGIRPKAADPEVQKVLDDFWNDPWNRMDQGVRDLTSELSTFGEQLIECPVNPISGKVRVGAVDPAWIDSVEYGTLEVDPGRAVGPVMAVVLRKQAQEKEQRRLRVVSRDEDPFSGGYGYTRGDCFYWAINKAKAATRGISDLFAPADWIDGYDKMLYAMMVHADMANRFIWDVLLKGATEEQVADWLKKNPSGPKPGAVRAHNEQVEWTAVSPQFGGYEMIASAKGIKQMAITGLPEHFFSEGGDANRATALEMGGPAMKMFTSRQLFVKAALTDLLNYVIDSAIAAGVLRDSIDRTVAVETPELSVRDQGKIATAFEATARSLSTARAEGLVDEETAANVLAIQLAQFGIEVDAAEMLAKARAEKEAERGKLD